MYGSGGGSVYLLAEGQLVMGCLVTELEFGIV